MTRAARTTALALALASSARGVAAQPLCAERAVSAEIDAALRDRVAGRGLAGYDRLVALHARCPSPRTLAQLALAEQSVRRWRDAYLHLAEALGQTRDPWIRDRRAPLETALHEIEERLPRLAPESNVPGAVLWVNGVEVGALPLAVPHVVTDASVALELRAAGYAPTRRVVTPVAGEVYRAMLAMEPASPSRSTVAEAEPRPFAAPTSPSWIAPRTTAAPSPSSAGTSPARVLAWVTGGAAVVGLAVGAAGLTLQRARAADFRTGYTEEACIATPSCDAARTQVHDAAVVAWAGLLAGTGLAVTAAVLFAVSRGEARPARAALGCAPTLHLAGGQCALSF
jgi:hypothetical protein